MPIATVNPSPLLSPSPKHPYFWSVTRTKLFDGAQTITSLPRAPLFKCRSDSGARETNGDSLKDALSGMVDQQVGEILNREENRDLLEGLEKASRRVEIAKRELAEIEKRELEEKLLRNYINQLEIKASEVAECQREISVARSMIDEAERSILQATKEVGNGSDGLNRDEERWESVKAASISAVVGTIAGLPICFTQVTSSSQLILPLAITFASCALFGVTFRYTVRRDLDNIQLKTGTAAAFSIVKGLGTLGRGPPLELNTESFLSHFYDGALRISENLLIFVFAAVAIDFCFKMMLLSPFPMRSASKE
ncbi:hypothetical protein HS088_TW20G00137 [Tripterygium wilfordii]|uniref:Homer protein n=1 Tax=Tripterygium wilfordii TaxID=458696 RepID=A0A7J7C6I9_TRIWF|nr:uncharacterized protein LOC119987242 [Tripterygium wilfordii]KAF5729773.1 hypothetical protein HS088_TW20G00137 [Tripterygium wilfordii]